MAKPQVGRNELATNTGILRRTQITDERGYVSESRKSIEACGRTQTINLLPSEIPASHRGLQSAGKHGVDEMAVGGKVRGGREHKPLQSGFADAVRELGLAGKILPDGADDAEARRESEKLVL
jgi:hypothetical protein